MRTRLQIHGISQPHARRQDIGQSHVIHDIEASFVPAAIMLRGNLAFGLGTTISLSTAAKVCSRTQG